MSYTFKNIILTVFDILNSDSTSINVIDSACDSISKNISLTVLAILNSDITPIYAPTSLFNSMGESCKFPKS